MDIKIDGETIKLSQAQAEQFKRAILKETSVPAPKGTMGFTFYCKSTKGSYPLVMTYPALNKVTTASHNVNLPAGANVCGRDFSLTELKTFIAALKAYACQIWSTAAKELKNV